MFREIWTSTASNQQSILLGFLGTRPRTIKGRPAQTNRNKGPGRGRSKPLRRGDQTKTMTVDGVMGRVRGSRRVPRKDEYGKISRRYRILVEMESLEMEILSTLPRPRARRGQYPGPWRADEHSDGDSGELNGDSLARFHAESWTRFTLVKRVRRWDFVRWKSGDVRSPFRARVL
ncbi:hypothetical protein Acr_07g0017070 [Actinidia rufa]|uniref:Uncharacterized protein n=1 Tax=Actinidia rufa TaxID=165716 RepID=A0A7J0EYJ4_9ERIC|nr:hypothetical protein Acr_07g0017070 [Actinidia rufa]